MRLLVSALGSLREKSVMYSGVIEEVQLQATRTQQHLSRWEMMTSDAPAL
eukprot:SAG31_NODE_25703_length_456_cov_0.815126_1_plen_49_part_10